MTFAGDGQLGRGVLIPCAAPFADVIALVAEAAELWNAEHANASAESIGASWGCVGVLFRTEPAPGDWLQEWAKHFCRKASPISPVDGDGVLRIPWPVAAPTGTAVDLDVILATATKAEGTRPAPEAVADAWIDQNQEHERYFFENVRHGIRTPDDAAIWRRIEQKRPRWLSKDTHAEAVAALQGEAKAVCG